MAVPAPLPHHTHTSNLPSAQMPFAISITSCNRFCSFFSLLYPQCVKIFFGDQKKFSMVFILKLLFQITLETSSRETSGRVSCCPNCYAISLMLYHPPAPPLMLGLTLVLTCKPQLHIHSCMVSSLLGWEHKQLFGYGTTLLYLLAHKQQRWLAI